MSDRNHDSSRRKHDPSRNGVRQPTDAEAAERVFECKQLLSQGCYDGEVKKQIDKLLGLESAQGIDITSGGQPLMQILKATSEFDPDSA
jgi:hypothetical protein